MSFFKYLCCGSVDVVEVKPREVKPREVKSKETNPHTMFSAANQFAAKANQLCEKMHREDDEMKENADTCVSLLYRFGKS